MELWFSEKHTPHLALAYQVKETLYRAHTGYQELAVLDTCQFGRALILDGIVQTTIKDEFIYHEMLIHPAMTTHPSPRNVLVIGGGDGGSVREIVKYPCLEKVVLAELDPEVIRVSREFLPELSSALDHPKLEIVIGDGLEYLKKAAGVFDVIVVDSPDPIGAAASLFSTGFYALVHRALQSGGVFAAQTESPWSHGALISGIHQTIKGMFASTHLYLAYIPTYQHGMWSFTLGSKKHHPLEAGFREPPEGLRYYNREVHRAAFALPAFVEELLKGARA
jgi:spermidine synthase